MKRPLDRLDRLVDQFLVDRRARGFTARTLESYGCVLRRFRRFLDERGIDELADITAAVLADYQTDVMTQPGRNGRTLMMASQVHLISHVRMFFRYLVAKTYFLIDPAAALALPHCPRRPPDRVLDLSTMKRLLEAPPVKTPLGIRDRAMLELLYSTGVRASELIGLDIGDIDLAQGELRVRHGKGRKARQVPVGDVACQWVRRYLERSRPRFARRASEMALFVSAYGRRLHRVILARIVRMHAKAAGIRMRVSPHGLRHTFATHMLQGKASLRHLQEMLGHASLSTTQIYTKVDISDLKDVHRRCHPRGRSS